MKYDYNSKKVQKYLQPIILTAEDGTEYKGDFIDLRIDKETFETNCGADKDWKCRAMDIIDSEVKTLDDYLRGEVFCYTLEEKVHVHNETKCPHCGEVIEIHDDDDWEVIDGCSGFYGDELESNGILDELPMEIKFID